MSWLNKKLLVCSRNIFGYPFAIFFKLRQSSVSSQMTGTFPVKCQKSLAACQKYLKMVVKRFGVQLRLIYLRLSHLRRFAMSNRASHWKACPLKLFYSNYSLSRTFAISNVLLFHLYVRDIEGVYSVLSGSGSKKGGGGVGPWSPEAQKFLPWSPEPKVFYLLGAWKKLCFLLNWALG